MRFKNTIPIGLAMVILTWAKGFAQGNPESILPAPKQPKQQLLGLGIQHVSISLHRSNRGPWGSTRRIAILAIESKSSESAGRYLLSRLGCYPPSGIPGMD
jgi:hypothetical protein